LARLKPGENHCAPGEGWAQPSVRHCAAVRQTLPRAARARPRGNDLTAAFALARARNGSTKVVALRPGIWPGRIAARASPAWNSGHAAIVH